MNRFFYFLFLPSHYINKIRLSKFQNGQQPKSNDTESKKEDPNKIIYQLKKKVSVLTRKNEATNTDLRKVFRVLQSEVGDNCNLQDIVQNGSENGWRGRAEKVSKLSTKVKRLQIELENFKNQQGQDSNNIDSNYSNYSQQQNGEPSSPSGLRSQHPNFQSNVKPDNVEEQARYELQKMEQRRNETTEAIAQELDEMHQIAADQKSKLDGQKARLGTLENNTRKMRGEIKVLLKKTAADDSLIDALREEIAQNRNGMATMTRKIHSLRADAHGEDGEYAALKSMTNDQNVQMERQEQIVHSLRAELDQLSTNVSKDMVVKAQKDLALHDKNTDLSLLKVENDRLSELSEMFKKKYMQTKSMYEKTERKERELERRAVELERRLGNISKGGLKRQAPADQFQALKDRLALQLEENEGTCFFLDFFDCINILKLIFFVFFLFFFLSFLISFSALKHSFRNAILSKDDEMRILRSLTDQQQKVYEKAIKDIRAQVKLTAGQAQARIIKTQANNDGKMMDQLQDDNTHLRNQLRELNVKFRELEQQRRKRGQFPSTIREKVKATRSPGGMIGGTGGGDLYGLRAPMQ